MDGNGEQPQAIQVQVQIDGSGAAAVMRGPVPVYPDTAQLLSQPNLQTPVKRSLRIGREEEAERKPIVTLTTVLPPTTYREKEEDQSRSLGYIGAQRAVLRFLEKYAADQLQPESARDFTQSIDTKTKYPNWKDALRFCYWMRSQGFDTYAQIKPNKETVELFIADPITNDRATDKLYWEQNIKTGDIKDSSDHHQRPSRRNAVSATGRLGAFQEQLEHIQEQLEHMLDTGDPDEARLARLFDRTEALQQIDGS